MSSCADNTAVLLPKQPVRLIACPRPFSVERIERQLPEGLSVAAMMTEIGLNPDPLFARVFIDDRFIPKAEWLSAVPAAGQRVTVRVIPTDGGKDALRIVAMIGVVALSIFAPYAAPVGWGLVGSWTGAALSAAVAITGSLAVNALIPPPSPKLRDLSGLTAGSPQLAITGARNQANLYGPIPLILGRVKVFPPYGARPYTEVEGNDQYLRLLFVVGYGPLALSEMKIGQTPIEQFTDLQLEVRQGYASDDDLTLYPSSVTEDALSILITKANGGAVRVSQAGVTELSLDVTFPQGLFQFSSDGLSEVLAQGVNINVDYRAVGSGTWLPVNNNPAIAAAMTTALSGANNDLVFTALTPGTNGNNFVVSYVDEGDRASEELRVFSTGPGTFHFQVLLRKVAGVYSTASQIKAFLDAATFEFDFGSGGGPQIISVASYISIANAPGNNGTGMVVPMDPTNLTGGLDVTFSLSFVDRRTTQFRKSIRWLTATTGQFEVRVTRLSDDATTSNVHDIFYWTTLRSITAGSPLNAPAPLALVAMRIKATDQLNGVIDSFNLVASAIVPDWNGTRWVERETSNAASCYRRVFQGPATPRAVADSRMDLISLQTWHDENEAAGREFNLAVDFRSTVLELSRDVAAMGRARFGMRDGKFSVVRDLAQSDYVQIFTPRNSSGFKGTKIFTDVPHALRCRFVNPDKDWQQDERIVYADGYNADGSGGLTAATKFETMDFTGCTSSEQAWKLGRYHLAVAQLRPELYELTTDVEYLVCTPGDLVGVQSDIPLWGLGSGRIKTVTTDGSGKATAITVDEPLTMTAGTSYAVRIRKGDGTTLVQQVSTAAGDQTSLTFTTAIAAALIPAVGNLVAYGELGADIVPCLVKMIEPGPELSAKLTLVDYAPGVLTADSGAIPPFDSHITLAPLAQDPVPKPLVDQVVSDETVLLRSTDGSLAPRIVISLHFSSGAVSPASYLEVQHRLVSGSSHWSRQIFTEVTGSPEVSLLDVQEGLPYDIRLRTVGEVGQTSDWVTISNHTVVGKTSKPTAVSGVTLNGQQLVWAYPTPPVDLAGFRVRVHVGDRDSWGDAVPLHDGLVSQTTFVLFRDSGVRTYLVKAVDTSGNESEEAASLLVDYGATVTENVAETQDLKAEGFPGTITQGSVSGGNLIADSDTLFWKGDGQPFWTLDGNLFWVGTYKQMTYVATITPPAEWIGGRLLIELTVSANGWSLEYRPDAATPFWSNNGVAFWTGNGNLFWSGTRGDYVPWPGEITNYTRQAYQFRLITEGGATQGTVSAYQIVYDMPDVMETLLNVALAAGGTRLALTKAFRVIKVVAPTMVEDGSTARRVKVLDKVITGPQVQAVDASEVGVSAHADFVIQGY